MTIRARLMEPKDIRGCVDIVGQHPALGSRYEDAIQHLGACWLKLLGSDGFFATVFEDSEGANCAVLGAGVAVFVRDDFMRELKRLPFWIGPELTLRVARGDSPMLNDKEVRAANSAGGLNLAVWQTGVLPENLVRLEVGGVIMTAFVELFRGYLLKESVTQAETIPHVEALRMTGGRLWSTSAGAYQEFPGVLPENLVGAPHVIGMQRELAATAPGSWAASMFLYEPPQFGFSRGEQRLLLAALDGATDQELSDKLGVSLATVKKAWRSIYDRVAASSPELIPGNLASDNGSSGRGREKKQRVISYLRDHPEELRPVMRKLVQQNAGK